MGAFGQQLRTRRESRGLRLVDVALATEVCAHHLAALEHEHLQELAADPLAEDYVRTYAEYLGLDPAAVVTEFQREFGPLLPAPESDAPADAVANETPDAAGAGVEAREAEGPRDRGSETQGAGEFPVESEQADGHRDEVGSPPSASFRWAWIGALGLGVLAVGWIVMRGSPVSGPVDGDRVAVVDRRGLPARETAPSAALVPDSEPAAPVAMQPASEADEARPAPAPVEPGSKLRVTDHGVGTGVRNRRLVGTADRFREGGRVVFLTRIEGGAAGQTIDHVWLHRGREISRVTLSLGGPHWRTHSSKTLFRGSVGDWTVEARDASGTVLARRGFTCER